MNLIKIAGFIVAILSITQFSIADSPYDWVIIYYMPYDNDYSSYGEKIINELEKGITNPRIAVVVQADFKDEVSKGMQRIILRCNQEREIINHKKLSDNSADENEFHEYLKWVIGRKWVVNNYAIIFLGKGGDLDSICLDKNPKKINNPNTKSEGAWMSAHQAGRYCKIANGKDNLDGRVKLLFLQQSGRGCLQNIYSFVDSAEYIMTSPLDVIPPNSYYEKMIEELSDNPKISIKELFRVIMDNDDDENVYTLIHNSELKKLPDRLLPLLDAIEENIIYIQPLNIPRTLKKIFPPLKSDGTKYSDEEYFDLSAFLSEIKKAKNISLTKEVKAFSKWYKDDLIVDSNQYYKNGTVKQPELSLFIPLNESQSKRYTSLPINQKINEKKKTDLGKILFKLNPKSSGQH